MLLRPAEREGRREGLSEFTCLGDPIIGRVYCRTRLVLSPGGPCFLRVGVPVQTAEREGSPMLRGVKGTVP